MYSTGSLFTCTYLHHALVCSRVRAVMFRFWTRMMRGGRGPVASHHCHHGHCRPSGQPKSLTTIQKTTSLHQHSQQLDQVML